MSISVTKPNSRHRHEATLGWHRYGWISIKRREQMKKSIATSIIELLARLSSILWKKEVIHFPRSFARGAILSDQALQNVVRPISSSSAWCISRKTDISRRKRKRAFSNAHIFWALFLRQFQLSDLLLSIHGICILVANCFTKRECRSSKRNCDATQHSISRPFPIATYI